MPRQSLDIPCSSRTVQAIFEKVRNKAGIKKDVTVHSLRHSFATSIWNDIRIAYMNELVAIGVVLDLNITEVNNKVIK